MKLLLNHWPRADRLEENKNSMALNAANPLIDEILVPDKAWEPWMNDFKKATAFGLEESADDILSKLMPGVYWNLGAYAKAIRELQLAARGEAVIVANSDIWFDASLSLTGRLTEKELWAMGKWRHTMINSPHGKKTLHQHRQGPYAPTEFEIASGWQDVFVFRAWTEEVEQIAVPLGTVFCELRIAYWADRAGLSVRNPMYSIFAGHIHAGVPKYATEKEALGYDIPMPPDVKRVPPCRLSTEFSEYSNLKFPTKWHGIQMHSYPREK